MRRLLNIAFIALLTSLPAWSQSTSVTATITDTDGQTWNNGTGTATFVPGNPQNYHWPGGTIPNQVPFTMNGSGTFTVSLPDNTTITPLGSAWNFSICPNASSPCVTKQITTSGTSMNLSTQLSSVAIGPRFAATPLAYGYLDKEISPLPVQGAFYWNVTSLVSRQWTGAVWQNLAGGGGGGGSPASPANSIQLANTGVNGFAADTNFLIDPTSHTATLFGNTVVNAVNSQPLTTYDVTDTRFDGGLAAAIAGTSGFTPTQVVNYTLDYAWCYAHISAFGGAVATPARVILPTGWTFSLSGVKIWPNEELSGVSSTEHPYIFHADNTQAIITTHGVSDTVTCPQNSTTYTPGAGNGQAVRNLFIAGIGNTTTDIGIDMNCTGCRVSNIGGFSNGFGGQAVLMRGTSVFGDHLGYEGAQLKGCQVYINGIAPISSSPTGQCGAVEDDALDGEMDYSYSSDGAQSSLSGKGPGPCYPKCAGFWFGGTNGHANKMFSQVSDIGIGLGGFSGRFNDLRVDASSREAILISGGFHILDGATITSPCTSTALSANYSAGTATGCYSVSSGGGGGSNGDNVITNVKSTTAGIFGASYIQAIFKDGVAAGGSRDYYSDVMPVNANNTTANDWPILYINGGGPPPVVVYGQSSQATGTTATANIAGVGSLILSTNTPLTGVTGGIIGQVLTITGSITGGAVIANSPYIGTGTRFGVLTCSGLTENVSSTQAKMFMMAVNNLAEVGCDTQTNFVHLNYNGNYIPTNPSIVDFIGNAQGHQNPSFTTDVSQIHGTTIGTSACFEQEAVFADGSHVVTPLACTNINLATQGAGEIFTNFQTRVTAMNLYLVSNAQGNGVALGKYPAPTCGVSLCFWDGPTTIAAGGDGSTPPPPSDNNTGEYWAPFGLLLNTSGSQPTCTSEYRGLTWVIQNTGPLNDAFQICERQSTGSYAWVSPSGGGGTLTGSGTVGTMALWTGSTTNLGNGHYSESGGLATVTLPVQVNDGSGTNGLFFPEANPISGASGSDSFWSDSGTTNGVPGLMANENNSGAKSIVQIATPGTSGDSVKLAANGKDIVDNGPDGSNFTPTKVCGSGCGTGGTSTFSTGANDNNGWITINTGTSPTAGAGIVTVTYGGTYSAARKCSVIGANALALGLGNNQMIVTAANSTATNFIVTAANSAALAASSTYIIFYRCGK